MISDIRCFVSRTHNPHTNLAIEEWLFRNLPSTSRILFLYRNAPCIVVGRNQNPWKECNVQALIEDGVPCIRRKSGGGTVYHDLGNSIYSSIQSNQGFTRRANAELVSRALNHLYVPSEVNDRHDIVLHGKKISGSAFKLTSTRAYHHGTMLINTNLHRLRKYLKVHKPYMISKGVPSVPSPVTNLCEHSYTIDHESFCESVLDEFRRANDIVSIIPTFLGDNVLTDIPKVREYRDELQSWQWLHGQTPDFEHTLTINDNLHLLLKVKHGRITDAQFTCSSLDELYNAAINDLELALLGEWYHSEGVDVAWNKFIKMQGSIPAMAQTIIEEMEHVCQSLNRSL